MDRCFRFFVRNAFSIEGCYGSVGIPCLALVIAVSRLLMWNLQPMFLMETESYSSSMPEAN
jgi:hypothetical protein